jgi:hypothetical protein
MGAAGLTTWTLASSRRAAAAGPMTAVMLALLGTVAFEPALIYFRASFGWAVLLALGVRSPTRVGRPTVYENALPTEHVGIAGSAQPSSRARCQLGLEAPCSNPAPATEASEQSRTSARRSVARRPLQLEAGHRPPRERRDFGTCAACSVRGRPISRGRLGALAGISLGSHSCLAPPEALDNLGKVGR